MMQGHHHDRQPVVDVSISAVWNDDVVLDLQVPMGVQHDVPLWCHSCFWMVVMVKDGYLALVLRCLELWRKVWLEWSG
jgi:hypothetical protein